MIKYATGNLLLSDAQALVNAVNCEGYMGKGIAYQFKQCYPLNFEKYREACKSGLLRPGTLCNCYEDGKLIINFPTKDKWRNESRIEYIDSGLTALVSLIDEMRIESIAIPPLGAGNGGLVWSKVRHLIEERLSSVEQSTVITIYEPSKSAAFHPVQEPKLSTSAIVLMEIKQNLVKFGHLRLQKTGFFMNLWLDKPYFKFEKYKYGPYSHAIDVISANIKEFQLFHNADSTAEAEEILYKKIVSKTVDETLNRLRPAMDRACTYVNSIRTNHELECLATVCFIVNSHSGVTDTQIIDEFMNWPGGKAERFCSKDVVSAIEKLYSDRLIEHNLDGYICYRQH